MDDIGFTEHSHSLCIFLHDYLLPTTTCPCIAPTLAEVSYMSNLSLFSITLPSWVGGGEGKRGGGGGGGHINLVDVSLS